MSAYHQSRWSLSDLFPAASGPALEAAFHDLEQQANAFEQRRPALSEAIGSEDFLQIVAGLEALYRQAYRLNGFASLWFTEDTQNQSAQTLLARVEQFLAELNNRTLFFELWWKALPDEAGARLMAAAGDYRYWLEAMLHFRPHTLNEAEEKIINIKNVTGASALQTLYDSITNRYTFQIEVDGELRTVTRDELMVYVRQPEADLRRRAYQELYRVYGEQAPILGQIYQTLVRDWRNEQVGLRHFAQPITARNLINDIPDAVIDTLMSVCQRNAGIFQRYFRLKARWLGLERLRRCDIYAPVAASQAPRSYGFGQAADLVLDSFQRFEPHIAALAEDVLRQNHVDSEVRKGKRGGAFCMTVGPDLTPWVLVNYQSRAEDVATLAHELGHAVHSLLANGHSLFTQQACLPLAETASTFGEMLLVDRLLKEEQDEQVRRDLLFKQIDDAYATIQRQIFFALFERQAHEMIQQGASVDELADAYLHNLASQFGDSVEVSDEFRWEWVSIPHIYHVPFYVYAYTFGQLLVLALYRQYRSEGEHFKPRYLKILAAGGSEAPERILAEAGIDIRQENFWQGGFDVLDDLVRQLEALPIAR